MTGTGFTHMRAFPHDATVSFIVAELRRRGYQPQEQQRDGDNPDIRIIDHVGRTPAWVDVKTRTQSQANFAVKHGALAAYWRLTLQRQPVYVVWVSESDSATVDTVLTLTPRIFAGPRRASGNGSNTDYVLVKPGGTPFYDFFAYPKPNA